MNSTPDAKATEANEVLVKRADEQLAHAYDQIARADEQLARATEQLSKLERNAVPHPSAVPRMRSSPHRGPALRGVIGLVLAACVGVAAFAWQSPYGNTAKLIIAHWRPQLFSISSPPLENVVLPVQPSSIIQVAAAEPTSPQQAALGKQVVPQNVVPTMALAPSPELTQLLQTMAHDLANAGREIERIKAGQEQMTSDLAKAVVQLNANQEQMAQLMAKASEHNLRLKPAAATQQLVATPTQKLVPRLPSPQARAQPLPPTELRPDHR